MVDVEKLTTAGKFKGLFGLICVKLFTDISTCEDCVRELMEIAYDISISCFQLILISSTYILYENSLTLFYLPIVFYT
jgi:hypothetical protein